ncbi:Signal transduction histidine kinase [Streptomyces sp. DvalAA-14]|uniref:sensor histidine kinase n=1 Tax=unclassified Streptomyces TaxID=2593676 RepID=UPI00081B49D1|nr:MULTISPECIES: histidine kinase [unclassified Streptomyces]MYS23341.1 two-component sensor histidine kinase [Streptomyces sp. SID4948]SCE31896.1 Signal transduction histidine kinase [Streptomyces sp. DvalAA-14]
MTDAADGPSIPVSPRVATALAHARDRRERRARRLLPVLWGVLAAVAAQSLTSHPAPGASGVHLAVALVLAGCLLPLAVVASGRWQLTAPLPCVVYCLLVGGFGLALGILQPGTMSTLPPAVGVMTAFLVLRPPPAFALSGVLTGALVVTAVAGTDGGFVNVASQLLFCAVLALMAVSIRQAGDNEIRAELLLAQLEDAREAEALAAALAERTRIAQDLHDVLAQTLSGLAIQVQAARLMARRQEAGQDLRELLDRAAKLVKDGLGEARRAVGVLRGDKLPSLERLPELVERYRTDMELDVRMIVSGTRRALPADAGQALYRGAQEALTNVARYARGARTTVTLCYAPQATTLTVEDLREGPGPAPAALAVGSGLGLTGMRERLNAVGGNASAGPTERGWTVRMVLPV